MLYRTSDIWSNTERKFYNNKPVNISSLDQQQSKGLDTPLGDRLAGNKARGYTMARTTQPVRTFNKVECNLQQVASWSLLHYKRENLITNNSHASCAFAQGASTAFCTFTVVIWHACSVYLELLLCMVLYLYIYLHVCEKVICEYILF